MRELMAPIPFPNLDELKAKILMESVRLFVLKGYSNVLVHDIASAVNIQPAFIYKQFPHKQDIMETIMQSTEEGLYSFYNMLDRLSSEAQSFDQILNNIFIEGEETANPFIDYSIYCAMTNQFQMECCRRVYYDIYFMEGHMVMRRQLETAIRRGLVEPFDIVEVATTMTNCFVSMVSFQFGHFHGFFPDFHKKEWYKREIDHIRRMTKPIGQ